MKVRRNDSFEWMIDIGFSVARFDHEKKRVRISPVERELLREMKADSSSTGGWRIVLYHSLVFVDRSATTEISETFLSCFRNCPWTRSPKFESNRETDADSSPKRVGKFAEWGLPDVHF